MDKPTAERLTREIWGDAIDRVQLRPDGGADVDMVTTPVSEFHYHRLDKHGRVACHVTCQDAQKSFIQAEWLKGEGL